MSKLTSTLLYSLTGAAALTSLSSCKAHKEAETQKKMNNAFSFIEQCFGNSREMLVFMAELSTRTSTTQYIARYGNDRYYAHNDELQVDATRKNWRNGYYHTGDLAWRDEDGFFWYVGRADDVIKSSGYRIGPFEIESVIMELPYVLECGVSPAPDPVRGQVVKASIVLVKGKEGTEELKKEIQNYVKNHTAPNKYPRIVEFRTELPKTISGKIQRNKL